MTHDAHSTPASALNPAPGPDGTTQGLSGAQTGDVLARVRRVAEAWRTYNTESEQYGLDLLGVLDRGHDETFLPSLNVALHHEEMALNVTPAEPPARADRPSLGDALRALTIDGVARDGIGPLWYLADQADRLEHEADVGRRWVAQAALLEAQVGRVRGLADAMANVPDHTASEYDRGRVDQRHQDEMDLRAAIDPEAGR